MSFNCNKPDEGMHLDHVQRLTKLEEGQVRHEKALQALVPSVNEIKDHLKAIKWFCAGALFLYGLQKFGLDTILQTLFKKLIS